MELEALESYQRAAQRTTMRGRASCSIGWPRWNRVMNRHGGS